MPVLGEHDRPIVVHGHLDLAVQGGDDGVAAGHAEPPGRVSEVILDIDHDEGRPWPVALHGARVAQGYPMSDGSSLRSDSTSAFDSPACGGSTSSR